MINIEKFPHFEKNMRWIAEKKKKMLKIYAVTRANIKERREIAIKIFLAIIMAALLEG